MANKPEWRKIRGYANYEVSKRGEVRSWHDSTCAKPLLLCQWKGKRRDGNTDLRVSLYKMGKKRNFRVHRLVARAFLPNPLRYREVDHKDGNTHHNYYKNLEWVSRVENERRKRERMKATG